jgi:predicted GNAT superfamily acetyltransferase
VSDGFSIRDFATHADYAACVELQRDTWGRDFNDVVPASVQLVSQKVGGVAAGAFDATGRLMGFVYGMTGVKDGRIVHWSDMLAVRPEAQNAGLGRRLKEHQRKAVARVGGELIFWTFDPLQARNAHLNFNVFGVRAVEYVRDMYGDNTGSDLHRGIGTDRLVVAWPVRDADIEARRREIAAAREQSDAITVEVPTDVTSLLNSDPARAREWRESSRKALTTAMKTHRIDGFRIDKQSNRAFYLLTPADGRRSAGSDH